MIIALQALDQTVIHLAIDMLLTIMFNVDVS